MKLQHIYVMAGVLVLLIVLTVVSERPEPVPTLEEQAGLVALMPGSVKMDNVLAIELSAHDPSGSETSEDKAEPRRVRLERQAGGKWTVASAYGAPAKAEKVAEFLNTLSGLQGDFVSEKAERFDDYQVNPERSIHIRLFGSDAATPLFHLHVGKNRGSDGTLVRLEGGDTVYAVAASLRSDMGIWSSDETNIGYSSWLDKRIVDLESEKIKRIELVYPDHDVTFEKVEKPEAATEGEAGEEEGKPAAFEWRLLSRSPGGEFKQTGVDNLLRQVSGIEVQDVIDPARKKELGLDEPTYRLKVVLEDGTETEILAVRDRASGDGYVMLPAISEHIWELPGWRFDATWKAGTEFFDLGGLATEPESIRRVTLTHGEAEPIVLSRESADDAFALVSPQTGFSLKADAVKTLSEAIGSWSAFDFAAPAGMVTYGFSLPTATLEIVQDDGTKTKLLLGSEHPGRKAWYVSTDPAEQVWVMEQKDQKNLFPALDALLNLSVPLVQAPPATWKTLTLAPRGKPPAVIDLRPLTERGAPTVEVEGKTRPLTPEERTKVQSAFLGLRASSLLTPPTIVIEAGEHEDLVTVDSDDGLQEILLAPAREDGLRPASVTGFSMPLLIKARDASALMIDSLWETPSPARTVDGPPAEEGERTVEPAGMTGNPIRVEVTVPNPFEAEAGTVEEK